MLTWVGCVWPQVDTSTLKPAEWERLRTGIALKTFTTLMKRQVVVGYARLQGVPLHDVCSVSHYNVSNAVCNRVPHACTKAVHTC